MQERNLKYSELEQWMRQTAWNQSTGLDRLEKQNWMR